MSNEKKTVKKKRKTKECESAKNKKIQFARLYFESREKNAKQAYIAAGFSERGADGNASRMLKNPVVKTELARLARNQEKRIEIKSDKILMELYKSAMSDITELFDENGALIDPQHWPKHIARAVSSLHIEEIKEWDEKERKHQFVGYTKKIKLWDKIKSLELLGKHLKLFQDAVAVVVSEDIIRQMDQARKRTILDE